MTGVVSKLCLWIAPEETTQVSAWPLTLLVRPGPLAALALLAVNDHVLKGSGWIPGVATGKLSDFAGLVYFPLLLVTLLNLGGVVFEKVSRREIRWSTPRLSQVTVACVSTALFFAAVQLIPAMTDFYARASAFLIFWTRTPFTVVTADPTDLIALPSVVVAWFFGRRSIAQLAPGRLRKMRGATFQGDANGDVAAAGLADVYALLDTARQSKLLDVLRTISDADEDEIDKALKHLRSSV